jgi:hypothetical protein
MLLLGTGEIIGELSLNKLVKRPTLTSARVRAGKRELM